MTYERNQNRILHLFEELEASSDESGSDQDIDNVSERSFDNETQQELDDENQPLGLEENDSEGNGSYFLGENGTKWFTVPNRSEGIVKESQGVRPIGQNAKTPAECWNLFITNDILQEIVIHTNVQISTRRAACQNSHTKKYVMVDITTSELKAFIGLLYLAGRFKSSHLNLIDLWRSDGTGIEIFKTTMTLKRFQFIQNCLRFDDEATHQERKSIDNLAAVRSVFEKFVACCKSTYLPSEEQQPLFHGHCSISQYMPGKPSKYGLKIYTLMDSESFYIANLEIYPGKQPPGPYALSNKVMDVIHRLVAPISKNIHSVTFAKGGVDVVDQLCRIYDVSHNTKRWSVVIFYAVLNISGINSMIIYKTNNSSSVKRRDFIRDLGIELISEHLQNRKDNLHLPIELNKKIQDHVGESSKEPPHKVARSIKRCEICPKKKDRKTKYVCYQCRCYLCMEHANFVCENCTRSKDE